MQEVQAVTDIPVPSEDALKLEQESNMAKTGVSSLVPTDVREEEATFAGELNKDSEFGEDVSQVPDFIFCLY